MKELTKSIQKHNDKWFGNLPFEMGNMYREDRDPYGLCVCIEGLLNRKKHTETACGKWLVKRIGKYKFEVEFLKTKKRRKQWMKDMMKEL